MAMNDVCQIEDEKKKLENIALKQQTNASDPNFCVWVEASAGTGKTKVLSDRVLRLLLGGVEPSKILCLTYTKAAAVEMKSRIFDRLSKWVALSDEKLKKELESFSPSVSITDEMMLRARLLFALTLDCPVPIKIQTIHSFCEEILKRFPIEAGIAPYFEVMDEASTKEALIDITKHVMTEIENFDAPDIRQAVLFLTENVSSFSFQQLLEEIALKRNTLMQIFARFEDNDAFLAHLRKSLNLEDDCSRQKSIDAFYSHLDKTVLKRCADALSKSSKTDKTNAALIEQNLKNFDFDSYRSIFLTQEGEIKSRLATKDAVKYFENIIQEMKQQAEIVRILAQKLKKIKLFEATKAMSVLARRLIEEYRTYKRKNARLDYEDLIVFTKKLLENENASAWVLYKLDGGLEHILIDEAQDTSPDQWRIIKALTDEFFNISSKNRTPRSVFAVGDRKQSIYGFQGAKPEKFDEMRQFYQQKIERFKKIRLDVSFRSTSAVLETVNALFALDEAKKGVATQEEPVLHRPYRLGEGGEVQIWPLVESDADDGDDVWYPPLERKTKATAGQKLALKIALKIKSMVENKEILASKNRPFQYRDFMVLVQRRNAFMDEFVRACKNNRVEVSGVDKLKLTAQIAIEDLLSVAKFLLLPNDDLSLAEALKSPLFNLNDDDLFKLCYQRGDCSLWAQIASNPDYAGLKENLSALMNISDLKRPFEIFSKILIEDEGRKKFCARLGAEAKDAIDEFMNLTLAFEKDHVPNLQNFVAWIEAGETEVKRELEQNENDAVRIMTVHGSKGLQAPVVILADTVREVKTGRESGLIFDDDSVYFPLSADDYEENCNTLYEKEIEKSYDEYRRLLYVAMTRAEDRLYIVGYGRLKKEDKSWYGLAQKALQKIGAGSEDDAVSYQTAQILPAKEEKFLQKQEILFKNTDFAYRKAPIENALSKPLSPSHLEDEDDTAVSSPLAGQQMFYKRGTMIHKILELLVFKKEKSEQKAIVEAYLSAQNDVSESFRDDIKREVFALLDDTKFSFLFSKNARAEVPVMGAVDGKIVSGQIDRLIVFDDKVIIVDFKTNRPAAFSRENVPISYIRQMEIYQKLIEQIYPKKTVETYILWTNTLKLMKI